MSEVSLRSRFAAKWDKLLYEVVSGLHFFVHHGAGVPDGDQYMAGAVKSAWDLSEFETAEGPNLGSHFARLVGRLDPAIQAVRQAALAFAREPGPAARAAMLAAVRTGFSSPDAGFALNASPFADDAEHEAWANHLLPPGDDAPVPEAREAGPAAELAAVLGMMPRMVTSSSIAIAAGKSVLIRGVAVLDDGTMAAVLVCKGAPGGDKVVLLPITAVQERFIRGLLPMMG